ncbi:hypothetical protein BGZ81_001959, partial [Podila clonocystis]
MGKVEEEALYLEARRVEQNRNRKDYKGAVESFATLQKQRHLWTRRINFGRIGVTGIQWRFVIFVAEQRLASLGGDGSDFGIKREGTADDTGTPGQVQKKRK